MTCNCQTPKSCAMNGECLHQNKTPCVIVDSGASIEPIPFWGIIDIKTQKDFNDIDAS